MVDTGNGIESADGTPTPGQPPPPGPTSTWAERFHDPSLAKPIIVDAVSFILPMGHSYSAPVLLKCSDGHKYVVKSPQDGLSTCTEQIVALLAATLSAPVPICRQIRIPQSFIDDNKAQMPRFQGCNAHGLRYVENCSNRLGVENHDLAVNRSRFAKLAVLYGWFFVGSDHQFFYNNTTYEVYSFDHGFFFPSGPNWSEASLAACNTIALDATIANACGFSAAEVTEAKDSLRAVTADNIASAVMAPPSEWVGLTTEMRVKAAEYLSDRSTTLRA